MKGKKGESGGAGRPATGDCSVTQHLTLEQLAERLQVLPQTIRAWARIQKSRRSGSLAASVEIGGFSWIRLRSGKSSD